MNETVHQVQHLSGNIALPGDKSIAHRTALLSALADGASRIKNYPESADPQSTLACLRQLGVGVSEDADALRIEGAGLDGLRQPDAPLDCGNSGTTMRLLAGILAGQSFQSTLTGDASLQPRPMARIANPLRQMGAAVDLENGHAPITLPGGRLLNGFTYRLPVASAQVKSCVLLAGLFAEGETTVVETTPARDHTERMLGLNIDERDGERHISVHGGTPVEPHTWTVPGDFSAAAFFLVAGSIAPGSELTLEGVGLNPSRTALLAVLREMGADLVVENERTAGGEPIGDLTVQAASLTGATIRDPLIPNLIDEVPVLAVAGACAKGRTEIRDAAELRVKETDRIAAMADGLRKMGATVETFEDGLAVEGGPQLQGATVDSHDDHRAAMALAVAGLVAEGKTTIRDAECAAVSFPNFWDELRAATAN